MGCSVWGFGVGSVLRDEVTVTLLVLVLLSVGLKNRVWGSVSGTIVTLI